MNALLLTRWFRLLLLLCCCYSAMLGLVQAQTRLSADDDLLIKGEESMRNGNSKGAVTAFEEAIAVRQRLGDWNKLADAWFRYGKSMLVPDEFYFGNKVVFQRPKEEVYDPQVLRCMQNDAVAAGKARSTSLQTLALSYAADVHFRAFRLDSALAITKRLLPMVQNGDQIKPYMLYYSLLRLHIMRSEHDKALDFGLLALKNCEALNAQYDANVIYSGLGIFYWIAKKPTEALEAYANYVKLSKQYGRPVDPQNIYYYAAALSAAGRAEDAVAVLKAIDLNNPVYGLEKKGDVYKTLAGTYAKLNKTALAEEYYVKWFKILKESNSPEVVMATANLEMLRFYANQKNWRKADEFYDALLYVPGRSVLGNLRTMYQLKFKLDSVRGNCLAAIRNLQLAMETDNKTSSAATKKRIDELQVGFETEKKDKNILLLQQEVKLQTLAAQAKEKNNQLLNASLLLKNAEAAEKEKDIQLLGTKVSLQQEQAAGNRKSIQLLTTQGNLQKASLARTNLIKNTTFLGLGAVLIMLGLVANQYWQKLKANKLIGQKNESLQVVLSEKDGLLRDKEWLLKEIHHRVKNNLQIVISLLNTQSAHLDSEVALAAIQESQHRMRSISLIHQKLYQSDNVASIDMDDYINDLVSYLQDSFSTGGNVEYDLQIEPIMLDVAQAVPIGLILNEAVTNSIKYAFRGLKKCRILIALDESNDGTITMIIADNGCGIIPGIDLAQSKSFGMNLMHGLTKQLHGELKLENKEGLAITLSFHRSAMTQDAELVPGNFAAPTP